MTAVPYSHNAYQAMGKVADMPEWDAMHIMIHGMPMSAVPEELCGTEHFVHRFVRPLSGEIYVETYIMGNYDGNCDFYTRFSMDEPRDSYEHMQAPVERPDLWWTITSEPIATGRTATFPREAWTYVVPRLHAAPHTMVFARL